MSKTILLVDDELKLREMVRLYLTQNGFRVVEAKNGREALFVARSEHPDLILLDLMMPEMNGTQFLQIYRRESATPIIMLTARVDETDEILGLELGADDYITKPFSLRAILARINAVLRRQQDTSAVDALIHVDHITLDSHGKMVKVDGKIIDVTPSEFNLLEILMHNQGKAFGRFELLDKIMDNAIEAQIRTIDVHIRHLREKIEPDPSTPQYIQTVYGLGYRFASQK